MARDRKRAKQRQQRRAKAGTLPDESHLRHENVPGSLEHASGEVDEFDARLVAGAGGQLPRDESTEEELDEGTDDGGDESVEDGRDEGSLAEQTGVELDGVAMGTGLENGDGAVAEDREAQAATRTVARRDGEGGVPGGQAPRPPSRRPASTEGENRVVAFLRASWSELQRVQWPDRRQVFQATAVVLGFVAIAGAYLGIADWAAGKIVDAIL